MLDFSERIRELQVAVAAAAGGTLRRESQFRFTYDAEAHRPISLIMPLADREFIDTALFAVMDMNLPEGFLLRQIYERSPKAPPTEMHLLALMGANGIGRLAYLRPGTPPPTPQPVQRDRLLRQGAGRNGEVFSDLVDAYLSTGSGLSGVQPKIIVPERTTFPVPNLIVKAAGSEYPGLVANEFLCLEVAAHAGIDTPRHELSDDGALLVIDRFDLRDGEQRLGFEDMAALADLRVGGALSDRKYRGSYEDVVALIETFATDKSAALRAFYEQLVLSILVRNGDAHLKNFGLLYDDERVWLAPVYDVLTTTIYPYERNDGVRVTDRTMALKLRRGKHARTYPLPADLRAFGEQVCRVSNAVKVISRLRESMAGVLASYRGDTRFELSMMQPLAAEWQNSMEAYAN